MWNAPPPGIRADGPLFLAAPQIAPKLFVGSRALRAAVKGVGFHVECVGQSGAESAERKIRDVGDDAVCRQNRQPFARRIEQRHHYFFVRRVRIHAAGARAALVPVGQSRFVAMMAVRDDEFLVRHFPPDGLESLRVGHGPQSMHHVVLVANFHFRL